MVGLTAYGRGSLVSDQDPYCPVPERVEPIPLYAWRWPVSFFITPLAWRVVGETEFRLPGAATYEVEVAERVAYLLNADGLPAGSSAPLVPGVSPGTLRLRVASGGQSTYRELTPRDTYVVTGEYVRVQYLIPVGAVLLASQPLPPTGPGQDANVVVSDGSVRITAVPARSRQPSRWVAQRWETTPGDGTGLIYPLLPGASEMWVHGISGGTLTLLSGATAIEPTSVNGSGTLAFTWHPLHGASHYRVDGPPVNYQTFQRGSV